MQRLVSAQLKEGLTVFRDQEFSAALGSKAVKRIRDVRDLRNGQFLEDAGPMAHPVRPDSYVEINNFYTSTIYNKGAELIRMLYTILGDKGYFSGIREYISANDGRAATIEDFVESLSKGSGVDLKGFRGGIINLEHPGLKSLLGMT